MDVHRKRRALEVDFEQGACCVLHVDFQVPQPTADREDPRGHTKDPLQVVELVDLGDDDPSPEIPACSVGRPVILIGVKPGKVLGLFDVYREQAPHYLLVQQRTEPYEGRMESQLAADRNHSLSSLDIGGQRFDWEPFDTFVVPGGTWCEHVNLSDKEPAILFVGSDEPTLKALALYQKHGKNDNGDIIRLY